MRHSLQNLLCSNATHNNGDGEVKRNSRKIRRYNIILRNGEAAGVGGSSISGAVRRRGQRTSRRRRCTSYDGRVTVVYVAVARGRSSCSGGCPGPFQTGTQQCDRAIWPRSYVDVAVAVCCVYSFASFVCRPSRSPSSKRTQINSLGVGNRTVFSVCLRVRRGHVKNVPQPV